MVSKFERQLPDGALQYLQTMPGWWRDVLDARYRSTDGEERRLLISVRDGYLNAYADGQSILNIGFRGNGADIRLRGEIHRKYVLGPQAGDGYLMFDGVQVGGVQYEGKETLQRWVTEALCYSKIEKVGVAAIAHRHPNIIDVELALPMAASTVPGTIEGAPQLDMAALERVDDDVRLVFYEAKQFSNPELRAENLKPRVLDQLRTYEDYASDPVRRQQMIDAYRNACVILRAIAEMSGGAVGSLVHEVANNPWLHLDLDPQPRLIVFGYDESHPSHRYWLRHEKALRDNGYTLLMGERAEDVRLPSCAGAATVEQDLSARLKGLARFVPIFTAPGFQFGTWNHSEPRASGIHVLPSCCLSDEGQEFYEAVYKLGWVTQFQWSEWMQAPEGRELTETPDRIAEATPDQLAKVITVFVRGDRFNEGLLNAKFEAGLLTAVVRRAEALLQMPPHSGETPTTKQ